MQVTWVWGDSTHHGETTETLAPQLPSLWAAGLRWALGEPLRGEPVHRS